MDELKKVKIKRQITIWWSELRKVIEYIVSIPLELISLLFRPIVIFIFYTSWVMYYLYMHNGKVNSIYLIIAFVFLIWVAASSEVWKEYYNQKYGVTKQ